MNFRNEANGTIATNGQTVPLPYRHFANGGVAVQLVGTWTGTVTFEATVNGTDFVAIPMTNVNSGAVASTSTANGIFAANVVGIKTFQVRASATITGTLSVAIVGLAG